MNLIDKEDYVSGVLYLLDKRLYTAFKLTSELRARYKRGKVEHIQLLALKSERHISACKLLRNTLRNCGLTYTGFTDDTRVILCTAGEYLHNTIYLFLSAYYAVNLALFGFGGKVSAVSIEKFSLLLLFFLIVLLLVLDLLLFAFGLSVLICGKTLEERHHSACSAGCEIFIVFFAVGIALAEKHLVAFFEILIAYPHFFKVVIYLRNAQFLCANKAKSLIALFVALYRRDKYNCLSFFTS